MNHFFQEKAMKYRSLGLGDKELKEEDYRLLIHQEYTFLKRPVFLTEKLIFIGNAKKTITSLKEVLSWLSSGVLLQNSYIT